MLCAIRIAHTKKLGRVPMGNDQLISEVSDEKQCVQTCVFVRYFVTRTNPSYGKYTRLRNYLSRKFAASIPDGVIGNLSLT